MANLIKKDTLVTEIEKRKNMFYDMSKGCEDASSAKAGFYAQAQTLEGILSFLDTLEVIDPYEQCIQYASIESGIKAHAEDYSFNIESELFNQLTKEQQALWRMEIEQAAISGGYNGLDLAKDPRYKENIEVKEVDEQKERMSECPYRQVGCTMYEGTILECNGTCSWVVDYPKLKELKAQKGERV